LFLNDLLYSHASSETTEARFLDPAIVVVPAVAVDGTLSRAYFFYEDLVNPAPMWSLTSYDLQTQGVQAKTRVKGCSLFPGGVNGHVGRLVRWGTNGFAVNCHEGLEIISGEFVSH
jgi:hypothetical protein